MAASESARNDLCNGLRGLPGADRAETLVTYLPVFDPSEIATKSDIGELETQLLGVRRRIDEGSDSVDRRFESMGERIDERLGRILLTSSPV